MPGALRRAHRRGALGGAGRSELVRAVFEERPKPNKCFFFFLQTKKKRKKKKHERGKKGRLRSLFMFFW